MWRLTLMPARRAASGLPPTAKVRRPKVVRLSTTQPMIATSAKMMTSSGMPRTSWRKKSVKPGTLTIWVLRWAMISASPRAAASIARVAMKGTTPPYATSSPLIRPQPSPTSRATSTITVQWLPRARDWVARVVAQTDDSATIAPTDRSMPPPVITNVMPIETTPITEASRRMVSALSTLANCSPAVAMPTMQRMISATTRPRLRPTDEPSSTPMTPPRSWPVPARDSWTCSLSCVAAAACLAFLCHAALPSITRSRTRCSSISVAGSGVHDAPLANDEDAVDQAEDFLDLARHDDHRQASVGQRADQGVDLAARADVDAAGRLVEQQHPAVAQQPPGQHHLLLVAAGEGADRTRDTGRAYVERLRPLQRGRALGRPVEEPGAGEPAEARHGDVLVDGLVEEEALALALLRRQPDARLDRGADGARSQTLAVDRHGAGGRLAGAVHRLQDLRTPRAHESGQADDLARRDLEAHVGEHLRER